MEYVDILDQTDLLAKMILQSELMIAYQHAYKTLSKDDDAKQLIQEFVHTKIDYENDQRFGRYHPEYSENRINVRRVKRKMDMNEKVDKFKIADRQLKNVI